LWGGGSRLGTTPGGPTIAGVRSFPTPLLAPPISDIAAPFNADRPNQRREPAQIAAQQLGRAIGSEMERSLWVRLESTAFAQRDREVPITEIPNGLSNEDCRSRECALGNLVADALLEHAPGTAVAIFNGGGLRAGLPRGPISYANILSVLPFRNRVVTVAVSGRELLLALEDGLSGGSATDRFPQIAGATVVWDRSRPAGRRILSLQVADNEGRFQHVNPERIYRVATSDFLRRGGDGYVALRDAALQLANTSVPDDGVLIDAALATTISTERVARALGGPARIIAR
jgi:2',3'-cyclic-nucleotide 2'-phosphodiesterase (5'-nucleotidase family)